MRARRISPLEVVDAHLRAIEKINPSINAIVTLADDVRERAVEAEKAIMAGAPLGSLHGLPITIKDTIDTAGLRTTSGSRLRAQNIPEHDAAAVARLKAAGAIVMGKTNVPEMAIPYETDNPVFGRANNPHNPQLTPGGSSGGEAAAIAACLSPAGIGSDLSGSIRVPASFCGIAGLKPTTGSVPMEGHTPSASGVVGLGACIGPMARRVADVALLFRVLSPAQFESHSDRTEGFDRDQLGGARVAWYVDDGIIPAENEVKSAVESAARSLADAGLEVFEATPPGASTGQQLWIDLFSRAANNEIASLYQGHEDEAGPLVSRLLHQAADEPAEFEDRIDNAEKLAGAVLEREQRREALLRWMQNTPLILAPVGAIAAFEHGRQRVDIDGTYANVFRAFSYSQTFNVFGLPSVAVPAGKTSTGLPIGVQVVGRPFEELMVLAAAAIIEEALGGWTKPELLGLLNREP
ncbi:MAG TPA: amidase [Pyrinomonadaceae bacterium]|nr:amidase [Pyrinomonadaceae bacterium]